MSNEKQEPRISLNLDDEDIVDRAPPSAKAKAAAAQPRARKTAPPPSSSGGAATGLLLFVTTVLVLALAAFSYYLFDQLTLAKAELAQSNNRLLTLEQRLSVTDESVTESSVSMQVKIKELDSEIRKLWDNVWKKQKEELGEHDAQLVKLEKSLAAMDGRIKSSQNEIAAAVKSFSADRDRLTSQVNKQNEQAAQLSALSARLDRAAAQAEVNKTQLLELAKKLNASGSLDGRVAQLETKVKQNDEWLESVNAFRRQVNRDIENLRTTITNYHAGSPPIR